MLQQAIRKKVGNMLCFNVLDSQRKQKQTSFLEIYLQTGRKLMNFVKKTN